MGTLPTLQVLLDNGTGTFPLDISSKVLASGYEISRGREDWQGAVTTGELSLTLDNSDGRFTPGSTILGTPSPIKVDARIRLVESSGVGGGFGVGGFGLGGFGHGGSNRFTGYVKSWPVSWPAVVTTFSTVQVTVTDAQARAERRPLRSMLEEEILSHSPTAYYTLGEAAGSTSAGDSSGNQATPLTIAGAGAAMTFGSGIGPGTDGLTAAMFFGGKFLSGALAPSQSTTGATGVWFNTSTLPGSDSRLAVLNGWGLVFRTTGVIQGSGPIGFLAGAVSMADGLTHFAAVTSDGATATLWIDGVSVATAGISAAGVIRDCVGGSDLGLSPFTGTVSHVASWPSLTGADVAAIYRAGAGLAESGTSRITRLAGYAGVPVGSLDTSLTNVPGQSTTGKSAFEAIQEVADAELGLVFVDGSGSLTFHNRNRVAAKTVPDLTLDRQWVTPDVQPVVDDQRLINYSEVTAVGTGSLQTARSATSETAHGRYPDSRSYLVRTDAEALSRANWIIGNFAEPTPRYGTLTINLYGMPTSLAATVVGDLDLNCWLRVTSLASQNPGGTTADVVVQSIREEATAESWTITCNVVARSLYAAWILGDPTYGVLGSTTKLYVG
jgi:hypothetical protein